jgi:hypothetical protein
MKKNFSILVLLLFVFGISLVNAQNNPYLDGEVLSYEGKLSKLLLRGISVADLTFSVSKAANDKDYLVKAEATSKGTLLKLFRFKFLQRIESTVDSGKFTILRTLKRDEQGERVRDSEAAFDYSEKQVTYVETDPKDAARPPRRIASSINDQTYDLISGVYVLRSLPLGVNKTFNLTISDSGLVYEVPVRVTAREMQKTVLGRIMCFKLEPQVFGTGRMIEQNGSMFIWITDDNRRIPVRSTLNTSYGKIEVRLTKVENGKGQK